MSEISLDKIGILPEENKLSFELPTFARQVPELIRSSNEILFFAGSFNPWHEGHDHCLKSLFSVTQLPTIILPDKNPFKDNFDQKEAAARAQLIIERFQSNYPEDEYPFLSLFLGTYGLSEKNPTYNYISRVKKYLPGVKLNLLMGDDSFVSLRKWFRCEELLFLLDKVWVVPRGENKEDLLGQLLSWDRVSCSFEILNAGRLICSSTEIRKQLSR